MNGRIWIIFLACCLWAVSVPQTQAQITQVLPRGLKAQVPGALENTGGSFLIEQVEASLDIVPYSQSFTSTANLQILSQKGAIKKLQIILHHNRRVTNVTIGGTTPAFSHIGSFLVIDLSKNPLEAGQKRTVQVTYAGKLHSVSRQMIRNYQINKYTLKYKVIPNTGNLEGTAQLDVTAVKDPFLTPKLQKAMQRLEQLELPPDPNKSELILGLNNEYTVQNIQLNNQKMEFYHTLGGIHVPLSKEVQPGQQQSVQVGFTGKVNAIDKNLLWDSLEPLYRMYHYYPSGVMNMGSY